MEINVYSQYFEAAGVFSGVERRGALVLLISDSEAGMISYRAAGRRSKKREAALLETLQEVIDGLAAANGASVDWARPLGEARRG